MGYLMAQCILVSRRCFNYWNVEIFIYFCNLYGNEFV